VEEARRQRRPRRRGAGRSGGVGWVEKRRDFIIGTREWQEVSRDDKRFRRTMRLSRRGGSQAARGATGDCHCEMGLKNGDDAQVIFFSSSKSPFSLFLNLRFRYHSSF
jgi:hypothetical protein